jgi:hypothetical protein
MTTLWLAFPSHIEPPIFLEDSSAKREERLGNYEDWL